MPPGKGYDINALLRQMSSDVRSPTGDQLNDIVQDRSNAGAVTQGRKKKKRKHSQLFNEMMGGSPLERSDKAHQRRQSLRGKPTKSKQAIKNNANKLFGEF